MNQQIATVNGKAVYSDKKLNSIDNTRITFTDGSWCDVSTGEVVNNGKGFISIGTPLTATDEQTTFGPQTFLATTLDVQGVEADVDIKPINSTQMTVTIVGPKSAVEDIKIRLQGDTLIIQSNGDGSTHIRGGDVVISGRGAVAIGSVSVRSGGVHTGGRNRDTINTCGGAFVSGLISVSGGSFVGRDTIVVSDGDGGNNTKIIIGVPKGSAVKVTSVQGNVVIGDTNGQLHANVFGSNDIKAGKVRDATLAVQGSGNISILAVNGNLSMTIQGSGNIRVRGGSVGSLMVNVMGSGNAKFNGEAMNANLFIMGSGDIDVASVKNKPVQNVMGSGDINVGKW